MTTSEPPPIGGYWPTPSANQFECDPAVWMPRREREKAKHRNGNGFGLTLAMAVQAAAMQPPPQDSDPELTLFAADSLASPSASPGRASRRRIAGGSGQRSQASFATYDPGSSSWRTSRVSLDGEWETYSETWPNSGMTRSGTAYRRPSSVPPIYATGSGSWHTPQASDAWVPTTISENTLRRGDPDGPVRTTSGSLAKQVANPEYWPTPQAHDARPGHAERVNRHGTTHGGRDLTDWVAMWPTPTVGDSRNSRNATANRSPGSSHHHSGTTLSDAIRMLPTPTANRWDGLQSHGVNVVTGQLNPTWVEWLMGYPAGWTDCED